MATKAERFRHDVERSGAPRPKSKKESAKKRPKPRTGLEGERTSRGRRAVFADEAVAAGTPSRKSTRRSKHRQKAATTLTGRNLLMQSDPHHRHDRGRPAPRAAH